MTALEAGPALTEIKRNHQLSRPPGLGFMFEHPFQESSTYVFIYLLVDFLRFCVNILHVELLSM